MNFCAVARKIYVPLTLIAFGYGVPVGFSHLYAVLLHPRMDKLVLTFAYLAEVVQVAPQLNIEARANDIE